MSATNRGSARLPDDFYATPAACVDALLSAVELPGGIWCEPAAGDGAIIKAVNARRADVKWCGFEIREEARVAIDPLVFNHGSLICDFLTTQPIPELWPIDVVISNPPFSLAQEFIEHALLNRAKATIMLLRINFLGSIKRAPFFRAHMPDVYVLPNRPSFAQSISCSAKRTGCDFAVTLPLEADWPRSCPKCGSKTKKTTSDATEYAWFVWPNDHDRSAGRVEVL